jgi:hypothetical protein
MDPAMLPFAVGDIVKDPWENEHLVFEIDPKAMHGMGIIRTRRLKDGVVLGSAMGAHCLTFVRREG